jgi:hypothetical protein
LYFFSGNRDNANEDAEILDSEENDRLLEQGGTDDEDFIVYVGATCVSKNTKKPGANRASNLS